MEKLYTSLPVTMRVHRINILICLITESQHTMPYLPAISHLR